MKLKDLQKRQEKNKQVVQKAPDRRKEFIKRMKLDPDFNKYFMSEIKKEIKELNSLSNFSKEIDGSDENIKFLLAVRKEKIKLIKKIFQSFL